MWIQNKYKCNNRSALLFTGMCDLAGQMGLIYHVVTLPLYKNATDAKLENTLLSAGVFIRTS